MVGRPNNFPEILQDPNAYYEIPKDVLGDRRLSDQDKIKVLQQWKYDAIHMQTSEAENMSGGERSSLDQILECLRKIMYDKE